MVERYSEYRREEERQRNRGREYEESRGRSNPEDQLPAYYRDPDYRNPEERQHGREEWEDRHRRETGEHQAEEYQGRKHWREPEHSRDYRGSRESEERNRDWGRERDREAGVQSRMVARISDEEGRWREQQNRSQDWEARNRNRGREFDREQHYAPGNVETRGYDEYRRAEQYHTPDLSREETLTERVGRFVGVGPKGYRRSDQRILEDVSEGLEDHPAIDASQIEVSVREGEVTLSGSVDNRVAKRLAEDVAANCRGVRDVHNQIRVSSERVIGEREPGKGGHERVA